MIPLVQHLSMKSADAIVATPETRSNCEEINRMRESNELPELTVLEVPHMLDYSGKIISSSRIRSGKIDSDGNPWIDDQNSTKLKMVTSLDSELKTPMGTFRRTRGHARNCYDRGIRIN